MNLKRKWVLGVAPLLSACTLTVGHPPESRRVTQVETRAELAIQVARADEKAKADDLARALAELNKVHSELKVMRAVNAVLIRTGYGELAREPPPRPAPKDPKPAPAATPKPPQEE